MAQDGMYFYSMVSFLVLATVIILVYIFLSMYMKKILGRMDDIEKKITKFKK